MIFAIVTSAFAPKAHERAVSERYATARALLMDGDYKRALEMLENAPKGDSAFSRLLRVARAGIVATRDAVRTMTQRFTISYPPGVDEMMIPYLAEALEEQYDALLVRLGFVVPVPIRVEVVSSVRTLAEASGLAEEDVVASGVVAISCFNKIVVLSPSQMEWGYPYADTAAHELVHHFLTFRGGDKIPVWFQEAVAKYLERLWRGEAGFLHAGLQAALASAAANGRLIPITSLRRSMANLGGMEHTALAFAELSSFAGWLERRFGPLVFIRLLDAMIETDEERAFLRVTRMTLADASKAWSNELGQLTSSTAELKTNDQGVTGDEVRLGDLLLSGGKSAAAARAYSVAMQSSQMNTLALVVRLATALLESGDYKGTIETIGRSRFDESEFPVLAGLRGRALVALGRFHESLGPLLEAVRTDPYDQKIHAALELAFRAVGDNEAADRERRLTLLWR